MIKHAIFAVKILLISVLGLISACGGGGSSDSNSDTTLPTDTTFKLFPSNYFSEGYTRTYNLTGSDSQGRHYTSTITQETKAQSLFNGQAAIPIHTTISIKITETGQSTTMAESDYYSTDRGNLMYLGSDSDEKDFADLATSMDIIPITATLGSSGNIGSYSGTGTDAGQSDIESWQLTDAGNGLAYFTQTTIRYTNGNQDFTGKTIVKINQQGDILSLRVEEYYTESGVTFTLSGE